MKTLHWSTTSKIFRWPTTSNKLYKLKSPTPSISTISSKAKLSLASCGEINSGISVTGVLVADSLFFAWKLQSKKFEPTCKMRQMPCSRYKSNAAFWRARQLIHRPAFQSNKKVSKTSTEQKCFEKVQHESFCCHSGSGRCCFGSPWPCPILLSPSPRIPATILSQQVRSKYISHTKFYCKK